MFNIVWPTEQEEPPKIGDAHGGIVAHHFRHDPSPLFDVSKAGVGDGRYLQWRHHVRSDRERARGSLQRCLVPATGWYEWQKIDAKTKRPFHFQPAVQPFAFGGVYDVWNGDRQSNITSFSIVTTAAAPSTAQYHDRMPLILEESQFEDWMREPPEGAAEMMKPYAGKIEIWPVPTEVGNVRNNRPELMERAAAPPG